MTIPPPPEAGAKAPAPRRSTRPLAFLAIGVALAAVLAVVLFVGIGTGASGSQAGGLATPGQQPATPLEPGINAATSQLLSLDVLPAAGHQTAPPVKLTDQSGQQVSLAQFRGKVVIVSANDDECTDLCTLLANDIVAANHDLGAAAKNVVWLSINANPYHPQVSAVRSWTDQHGLANQPNWYFLTGTPAQLAAAWSEYSVQVQLDPATRTVAHSAQMVYVGPHGNERAVTQFGTAAAATALFAHGAAQLAADLLPAAQRTPVGGPETSAASGGGATIGAVAPGFSLPYLQGGTGRFALSSTRGHWTVLDFWSSTCSACRADLPRVEAAAKKLGPQVDVIGVDVSDRRSAALAMAHAAGLTYPLVSDPSGVASGGERISGLPYLVVIDPSGRIAIRHPGTVTTEQLVYILDSLDQGPPPAG